MRFWRRRPKPLDPETSARIDDIVDVMKVHQEVRRFDMDLPCAECGIIPRQRGGKWTVRYSEDGFSKTQFCPDHKP